MSTDFLLRSELVEFRRTLRDFFLETFPPPVIRKRSSEPPSSIAAEWQQLSDLGALVAPIPEAHGGLGFGMAGAFVVAQEAGRALLPLPLTETLIYGVVCPQLCEGEGGEFTSHLLASLAAGGLRVTGSLEPFFDHVEPMAVESGNDGELLLTATLPFVPSYALANALLVCGTTEVGEALFGWCDDLGSAAVGADPIETLDLTRRFSTVRLLGCRVASLACWKLPSAELSDLLHRATLLIVAELIGVGEWALEMILEYAKTRRQFGRAIGSFQAVQHQLADASLALEQLTALAHFAVWCADNDPQQFAASAQAANGLASTSVAKVIETALQLHGGIGFTYEYNLHLYLRRALVLSSLFGSSRHWFRSLGESSLA